MMRCKEIANFNHSHAPPLRQAGSNRGGAMIMLIFQAAPLKIGFAFQ